MTPTPTLPKNLTSLLIATIRPELKWFLCLMILPAAWALEQIAFPYCTKLLIDTIAEYTGDRAAIYSQISSILLFGLGAWIFLTFNWRFLDVVEVFFVPKFQASLRLKVFEYIERHSYQYFSDEFSGSLANKISDLSNCSWEMLAFIVRDLMPVTISILCSVVVLGTVNSVFAIIFILFFIVHMLICIVLSKKTEKLSDAHSEDKSLLQGKVVDSLTNTINVRLFSRNAYELNYLNRYQQQEVNSHKKLMWNLFHVRVVLEIPSFLMIIGSVYFLIRGWQLGVITPGDFAFVITLAFNIMMSVWRLGITMPSFFKQIGTCQQALSLIRKPHEIVDIPQAKELVVVQGEIKFDNVHFHYNSKVDLFKNKNIVIKPGEKLGLVGFSGSGKSTFVNLILRYYDIESGGILIDNQNIADVTQDSLRRNISMIPQDVSLFHRTLRENILYGKEDATESEMIEASKQAHCHEFVQQLQNGYDTLVGERGIKLSGGQRQRIAVARAILKNAPILILDEATSALDSVTEKHIQQSLHELMQHRTTIVIAHRLSTLLGLDRILVFHKGAIIEQGNHEELVRAKGHYARLWAMQVGGFLPEQANTHPVVETV